MKRRHKGTKKIIKQGWGLMDQEKANSKREKGDLSRITLGVKWGYSTTEKDNIRNSS